MKKGVIFSLLAFLLISCHSEDVSYELYRSSAAGERFVKLEATGSSEEAKP